MKTVSLEETTSSLADYTRSLGEEPVIITAQGKPVAVMIPVANADLETVSMSMNPKFLDIIQRSRAEYEKHGGISSEELRRQLGIPAKRTRRTASGSG